ncbi:MAG: helix-turn-helix domain-containing protein [Chloroflexota bacterium]
MPLPSAQQITATARQRRVLTRLMRAATTPQAVAARARVVLGAADGASNRGLASQLGLARNTVQAWRDRWAAAAETLLAAEVEGDPDDDRALHAVIQRVLADEARPGAPARFTPEQLCQLMAVACEPPGASGRPISQWTPRELADEAVQRGIVPSISARSVGRFLVLGGGRAPAAPQPVLAHAPRRRPRGVRRAGAGHL